MATMNMVQALNSAMDVVMERDPNVVILGDVFTSTKTYFMKYIYLSIY